MGQALSFCSVCETPRDCDNCTDLHNWIMEALEEKAELQAYRGTGLEPDEILKIKADAEGGYLKQTARRYGVPVDRLRELAKADRDGRLQQAAGRRPIQL